MNPSHKNIVIAALIIFGTFLADFLFWNQVYGLNSLIFGIFWLAGLLWIFPSSRQSTTFKIAAVGTLLSAIMVVWHNSEAAKFAYLVSLAVAVGFAQVERLKSLWLGFWQFWSNLIHVPHDFPKLFASAKTENPNSSLSKTLFTWSVKAMIPVAVTVIFYALYYIANDNFAKISDRFWDGVFRIFTFNFDIVHVFYVFMQFLLVGSAFIKAKHYFDGKVEVPAFLQRQKKEIDRARGSFSTLSFSMLDLKKEYQQSLILLILLNALLLLVNLTDITHFWFDFNVEATGHLKRFVHIGTYMLIISILLAMVVLLVIYRGNLNFFSKSKLLRQLSTAWLVQNGILVISVGIRNWHYIAHHGLAYKRIGVYLFLSLVMFGLWMLYRKINEKRTLAWVLYSNSWAVYILMLLNACVPWDQWITHYNLTAHTKSDIDKYWLLHTVSDKNIQILEDNREAFLSKPSYPPADLQYLENELKLKRSDFNTKMRTRSWKSWNWAEARIYREAKE